MVQLLLEHGADIDNVDHKGNTALHVASYHGHVETVKLLLESGAQMKINDLEKTPLDVALDEEEEDVVGILRAWSESHTNSIVEDKNEDKCKPSFEENNSFQDE